ncbi:hypothetical protein GNP80_19170 [Aliivibrio fischeri]|uniref:imm11 family protein n=1 Tax=Aliivibrio fischeri TaxID=668 RepID=UPI0012DA900E|nr:DUF1629 domain-containing protein [Aliivibrio fischeri]MUK94541.1 hypothetical protein [Aliivibrio fischeri]
MKYDDEYYVLTEQGASGQYMLGQIDGSDDGLERLLSQRSIKRLVRGPGKVRVNQGDKALFSPCDYHDTGDDLVSEKFKQVIETFKPQYVDFYQADIINGDQVWSEHYFMHIWNHYRVMHQGRSKIDGTYVDDDFILESFSLDENLLDKIPLQERLIFRLSEDPQFLFHETVVAALKAANLTGVGFKKVKDWGISSGFDDDFYADL